MSPSPRWPSAGGGPLEELMWSLGENSHRCRGKTEPVMRTRNPGALGLKCRKKAQASPGRPHHQCVTEPHRVTRPSSVQTAESTVGMRVI